MSTLAYNSAAHGLTVGPATTSDNVLREAPLEIRTQDLRRIGEGIGRVVYASSNWVVKRERSPREVIALIVVWRMLRAIERAFPLGIAKRLMQGPSRQLRLLRMMIEGVMVIISRTFWFSRHIVPVWRAYHKQSVKGTRLAETRLTGSSLIPCSVEFPPTRVRVRGWPGWLVVCKAEERAESTLLDYLSELAQAGFFDEMEEWLDRFLEVRKTGWQHGLFSTDAHLKNFGIIGDRIVLLDSGGLTDRWSEVEKKLEDDRRKSDPPHQRLGLAPLLVSRPDIAARFDANWNATVRPEVVGRYMAGAESGAPGNGNN